MGILITLLELACKLIGLAEWFEAWQKKRAEQKQAQAIANAPTTDKEWADAAKKGDL